MQQTEDMQLVPLELIVDILSYLPVKSLCRFRCVSKSWMALIKDPQFVNMHLTRTRKQKLLLSNTCLYFADPEKLSSHDHKVFPVLINQLVENPIDLFIEKTRVQVLAGCFNGLFCIRPRLREEVFFICNPSTRESKQIPSFFPTCTYSGSYTLYGFSYVKSIDDYKFVKILGGKSVLVFSLRSNSWKIVGSYFPFNIGRCFNYGIPVNGAIHWFLDCFDLGLKVIVAFDFLDEKFRTLHLPLDNFTNMIRIDSMGDCLCIFEKENKYCWMMKEYEVEESWTKVLISDALYKPILQPTCFMKKSTTNNKWIICYREDGKTYEDFVVDGFRPYSLHVYIESLVSPNYNPRHY